MPASQTRSLASRLEHTCHKMQEAQRELNLIKASRDTLIIELSRAGHSYSAIHALCGLSRGRIAQIISAAK
jgi:hypothetical protein